MMSVRDQVRVRRKPRTQDEELEREQIHNKVVLAMEEWRQRRREPLGIKATVKCGYAVIEANERQERKS